MLVHHRLASSMLSLCLLILLCGELYCESGGDKVFPKNTIQCFRLGLKSTLTTDALINHAYHSGRWIFNIVTTPFIPHSTLFIPFSIFSPNFPEDKNQIVKRYVYSGTSGAASLQQFVEQNIYHRQGEENFWEVFLLLLKQNRHTEYNTRTLLATIKNNNIKFTLVVARCQEYSIITNYKL